MHGAYKVRLKVYLFLASNKGTVNNDNNKYNECGTWNVRLYQ